MRRVITLAALGALALIAVAQTTGNDLLKGYTKALTDAKSLSTTYTYQKLGDPSVTYTLELSKPNMARIDTPAELIVADGTTITTYDKTRKVYYKSGQTANDLKALFNRQELQIWAPFFNEAAFANVNGAKAGAPATRKGMTLNTLEMPLSKTGDKVAKLYLNQQDNVARQAELIYTIGDKKETRILDTKSLTLDATLSANRFAFNAPDGSKEVTADEIGSDRWYSSLDEAKAIANKTGKKIFVDFMASWCGPCKMLDAQVFSTDDFKKLSKSFVFLKIDVDEQKDVAQAYNIEAMPTQMVLDKDGGVLGKRVGYSNPADFFTFINGYAQ